jgi:glycosyltransferase involved in cell wall biosynthesis
MEPTPEVSVVIVVYNGERFIRRAVDSVINQTLNDFELVVIDDGSSDQTSQILNSYTDKRIKMVRNPTNLGISVSANRGIGLARSNLVARLDADDEMFPERLAIQKSAFAWNNIDLCFSRGWINQGAGKRESLWTELDWSLICWRGLFVNRYGMHSACMFDRESILSIGGYDHSFCRASDYDLWDRCVQGQMKFKYLSLPLIRYSLHEQSISLKYFDEQEIYARRVSQRAIKRLLPGLSPSELSGLRWLFYSKEKDIEIDDVESGLLQIEDLVHAFTNAYPSLDQRLIWYDVAACLNSRWSHLKKPLQSRVWPLQMKATIRARSVHTVLNTVKSVWIYNHV